MYSPCDQGRDRHVEDGSSPRAASQYASNRIKTVMEVEVRSWREIGICGSTQKTLLSGLIPTMVSPTTPAWRKLSDTKSTQTQP